MARMKNSIFYMRFALMTVIMLFFSFASFSQSTVEVLRDQRVDTLVKRYIAVHKKKAAIDGFRIQLIASSDRSSIYKVRSQFNTLFADVKTFLIYQAPNFKLRVGNYRTRLEAYKDLQRILPKFSGAFIVRDELKITDL